MNVEQNLMIAATEQDGIHVNLMTDKETDLDDLFQISRLKSVIYDLELGLFYILANKFKECVGVYVVMLDANNPSDFELIYRKTTMLDIDDCSLVILKSQQRQTKELMLAYKTVFVNTYSVILLDISRYTKMNMLIHFESFHLFELNICATILESSEDFVTVSSKGMDVINLSSMNKRLVQGPKNNEYMVHSLDSFSFLKLDNTNNLVIKQNQDGSTIYIQQEYAPQKATEENYFIDIYQVRISTVTLRELLIFQSLYLCPTPSSIIDLVNDQPDPRFFYRSYLELDGSNMTSILAFDSRSIKYLLDK